MKKEEYIETGYETHLTQLLKSNYDSILINGGFGTGKTTMLNHVLDFEEFKDKKKLELKVYEEYVEENYIDFLYEKLVYEHKKNTNKYKLFLKKNLKLVMTTLIDIALIVILAAINFRLKDGVASGVYGIFTILSLYFIFSILKVQSQKKSEKVEFIKKELEQYDFVIIDDLDRVYFDTNEILKMVQFLSEVNLKFKLILLSDKNKFEVKNIDVLEKYYDISFEIPSEIITQTKVNLFINGLEEIEYKDDIDIIKIILLQVDIRTLNKIISHYEYDKENNLQVVEKLFRSDYIFILIVYYKYGEYDNVINTLLEIRNTLNLAYLEKDKQLVVDRCVEKVNNLALNKQECNYLINNIAYKLGYKTYVGKIQLNSLDRVTSIAQNRLIEYPIEYKVNSFYLDVVTFTEVKENFPDWLKNEPSKINKNVFEMYKSIVGEKADKVVIDFIEENFDEGRKFTIFVKGYLDSIQYPIETYPNINYLNLVKNMRGYDDHDLYDYNIEGFKELWDKVSTTAQLEILEIESYTDEKYFLEIILNDVKLAKQIASKMIERNRPNRFVEFYYKTGKIEYIELDTIKTILQSLIDYKESLMNNNIMSNNTNIILETELEINCLQEYLNEKVIN